MHGHDRPHPAPPRSPPARSPSGSPRSSAPRSAAPSATRCASPTASASETLVKVMTDGILLAEIQRDRLLRRYDTIIVDEAHERSLNIDFILGYLTQLLPRRPDLKVIVTSATIDTERFSAPLRRRADRRGLGPHLPGRGPLPARSATSATSERARPDRRRSSTPSTSSRREGPGDMLVFLSRRAGDPRHRRRAAPRSDLPDTEVLPLYARLSAAEQHRVFEPHRGRRIVLATNVAETSLTVPGIRYVVDPGTARISRYSRRTKVQRLPDRAGLAGVGQPARGPLRPGRARASASGSTPRTTSPGPAGVHRARDPAHQPGLGHPADDRPRPRRHRRVPVRRRRPTPAASRDGVALLEELGALDARTSDSPDAAHAARPAAGPAARSTPGSVAWCSRPSANGCLGEVMIIAAALSIQDPRERPTGEAGRGGRGPRPLRRQGVGLPGLPLALGSTSRSRQDALSSNQFRKLCKRSSSTSSASGSGRTSTASSARSCAPTGGGRPRRREAAPAPPSTGRCSPGCSPTSA